MMVSPVRTLATAIATALACAWARAPAFTTTMFGGGTCGGGTITVGGWQLWHGGGAGGWQLWQGGRGGLQPLQSAEASTGNKMNPNAATPNAIAARMYRNGTDMDEVS